MPDQAINVTLDLEGLEVIGVSATDHLIELVIQSRFDAYAEGITNRVKDIKRRAYGFRTFASFRDWILVQCGTPEGYAGPA